MSGNGEGDPEKGSRRDIAKRIEVNLIQLFGLAREARLDFLAYLLNMAIQEARRLGKAAEDDKLTG
jgi:hypothetical protein